MEEKPIHTTVFKARPHCVLKYIQMNS